MKSLGSYHKLSWGLIASLAVRLWFAHRPPARAEKCAGVLFWVFRTPVIVGLRWVNAVGEPTSQHPWSPRTICHPDRPINPGKC